jgi:hypothetical protein
VAHYAFQLAQDIYLQSASRGSDIAILVGEDLAVPWVFCFFCDFFLDWCVARTNVAVRVFRNAAGRGSGDKQAMAIGNARGARAQEV